MKSNKQRRQAAGRSTPVARTIRFDRRHVAVRRPYSPRPADDRPPGRS